MCTIVIAQGVRPDAPLLIAANRDEFHSRASAGPSPVEIEGTRAVCGRDLVSGGTWLGLNEHGLFVAVTNQRTLRAPDPRRRSRGEVVRHALALRDTAEVEAFVRRLPRDAYNEMNLAFGRPGDVRAAYYRLDRDVEIERVLGPLAVLPNDRLDSPRFAFKIGHACPRVRAAVLASAGVEIDPRPLATAMASHALPSIDQVESPPPDAPFDREVARRLQAVCVHAPGYGTVSFSALAWNACGRPSRYLYAPGPPCTHTPVDVVLP